MEIELQHNGEGSPPAASPSAAAPFYPTRIVGLGLCLAVSRNIIETRRGKLEIVSPKTGHAGIVRISLPAEADSLRNS